MKSSFKFHSSALATVMIAGLLSSTAKAQTDYYFDPGLSNSGTGSGGTGVWDTATSVWYLPPSTDTTFPAAAAGNANFDGIGGTVTTDGSVDPANIYFNGSSAYVVNANASGSIDEGTATAVAISNSGSDVTLNAPITFTGTGGNGSNDANLISINVSNTGTGKLIFGSTVTNTLETVGQGGTGLPQFFQLDVTSGTVEFAGNITPANTGYDPSSGSPKNDNITIAGGATVLLDSANFDRFQSQGGSILINTPGLTVAAPNSFSFNNGAIGTNTTGDGAFTGSMANFGGTQTLEAFAANGRVTFSGDIFGGGVNGSREVISGPGIVEISIGTDYGVRYNVAQPSSQSNTDVGTEINPGATLVISNSSDSATGAAGQAQNSTTSGSTGLNNVVQLDPTGTLAGTGHTQQTVITSHGVNSTDFSTQTAVAGTGILNPGALSDAKVSSLGTLNLDNGLDATNGLTVKFDLNGAASDQIEVGRITALLYDSTRPINGAPAFALTLNGNVTTFNFTALSAITAGQTDTLFYSGANGVGWNITNLNNITSTGTEGFAATYSIATIGGVESLNVTFSDAPEPSTWALMALTGLLLAGSFKVRKLRA